MPAFPTFTLVTQLTIPIIVVVAAAILVVVMVILVRRRNRKILKNYQPAQVKKV